MNLVAENPVVESWSIYSTAIHMLYTCKHKINGKKKTCSLAACFLTAEHCTLH